MRLQKVCGCKKIGFWDCVFGKAFKVKVGSSLFPLLPLREKVGMRGNYSCKAHLTLALSLKGRGFRANSLPAQIILLTLLAFQSFPNGAMGDELKWESDATKAKVTGKVAE